MTAPRPVSALHAEPVDPRSQLDDFSDRLIRYARSSGMTIAQVVQVIAIFHAVVES